MFYYILFRIVKDTFTKIGEYLVISTWIFLIIYTYLTAFLNSFPALKAGTFEVRYQNYNTRICWISICLFLKNTIFASDSYFLLFAINVGGIQKRNKQQERDFER